MHHNHNRKLASHTAPNNVQKNWRCLDHILDMGASGLRKNSRKKRPRNSVQKKCGTERHDKNCWMRPDNFRTTRVDVVTFSLTAPLDTPSVLSQPPQCRNKLEYNKAELELVRSSNQPERRKSKQPLSQVGANMRNCITANAPTASC